MSTAMRQLLQRKKLEQIAAKQREQKKDPDSWYEDLGEGITTSVLDTMYGVEELATGSLDPGRRAKLEDWKKDAAESGWGTAGRMVGETAQMAAPFGVLTKVGKMMGMGAKAPILGETVAATGHGGLRLPDEGETRTGNAAMQGGFAIGGSVLGRTLATPFAGVRHTPAAERLRGLGAKLTPGRAREGLLRNAENFGEYLVPVFSRGVTNARRRSDESIRAALYHDAAPPTPATIFDDVPVSAKPNSMEELIQSFDDAYAVAWPKMAEIDQNAWRNMMEIAERTMPNLSDADAGYLRVTMNNIIKAMNKGGHESAGLIDEVFRNRIRGSKEYRDIDATIKAMRAAIRDGLPPLNKQAVSRVDAQYGKRVALGEGVTQKGAALEGGVMQPEHLMAGSKKASDKTRFQKGKGHFQQEAVDWHEVKGKPAGMLPTVSRRLVQFAPEWLGGPVPRIGSDMVAGNYAYQAKVRDLLRRGYHEGPGRYVLSPERLGAAYED